jgi:hypothetical protein
MINLEFVGINKLMIKFFFSLFFILTVFGLFVFLFFRFHFLLMLLGIEFFMLSFLFIMTLNYYYFFGSLDIYVFFLLMIVIEGSFGICLVIYYSRFWGGDYFSLVSYFYFDHSIIPSFHSIIKPKVRIIIIVNLMRLLFIFDVSVMMNGKNKAISKSKIKNKIVIKKNWDEKGIIEEIF